MFFLNAASPLYLFLEILFPTASVGIIKKVRASILLNFVASFSLFLNFSFSGYFLLFNSSLELTSIALLALGIFISLLDLLLCIMNLTK